MNTLIVDTVTVQPCARAYCSPKLPNGCIGIAARLACVVVSARWYAAGGGARSAEFIFIGESVPATPSPSGRARGGDAVAVLMRDDKNRRQIETTAARVTGAMWDTSGFRIDNEGENPWFRVSHVSQA